MKRRFQFRGDRFDGRVVNTFNRVQVANLTPISDPFGTPSGTESAQNTSNGEISTMTKIAMNGRGGQTMRIGTSNSKIEWIDNGFNRNCRFEFQLKPQCPGSAAGSQFWNRNSRVYPIVSNSGRGILKPVHQPRRVGS